ncbi:MAG: hypothetical protein J6W03_06480 [Bacteroidaceae bacterium]|nr:hypothetical protein [Bacteroidaceae bacterium]
MKQEKELDKLLKAAFERKAANVPPLSEDFAERVLKAVEVRRRNKQRTVALWVSGIAATLLVGFFLFVNKPKELPVVTQNTEIPEKQQTLQPEPTNDESKSLTQEGERHHVSSRTKPHVTLAKTTREVEQPDASSSEEPLLASLEAEQEVAPPPSERAEEQPEEAPVISPEMQALVDIYLAEEALQVAYKQQEQTEPLRAYIATLEGEELETSHEIISF